MSCNDASGNDISQPCSLVGISGNSAAPVCFPHGESGDDPQYRGY